MARTFKDIPIPRNIYEDEERIRKGRGVSEESDIEPVFDLEQELDELLTRVQQFAEKGGRDDR